MKKLYFRINPLKDRVTTHSKKRKTCGTNGITRPKPAYSFFAAHEKHALAQLPETGQVMMNKDNVHHVHKSIPTLTNAFTTIATLFQQYSTNYRLS